jgi:hypothetical protein
MDAPRIHSVIAAGLSDPALLARWRQSPELLTREQVDPAQLDLDALWRFAGLAEKIRCNPCRSELPLTFRMLSKTGLEIEFFASFAERATELRQAGRNGAHDKILALLAFLGEWHDPGDREQALLWDLCRHEYVIAELGNAAIADVLPADARLLQVDVNDIPFIRGGVRLARLRSDPRLTAAELRKKSPELSGLSFSTRLWLYWRAPRSGISIIETDELAYNLVRLVDGDTATSVIASRLQAAGAPVSSAVALAALFMLSEAGILGFREAA